MTLQQHRCIVEVVRQNLNVTAAARALYTSQPGVSRYIRLFEEELGIRVFGRTNSSITHVTPEGQVIIKQAETVLNEAERLRGLAMELATPDSGTLTIGATHTQARFMLPEVLERFLQHYPNVNLRLQQGMPRQVAEMAVAGSVDLVITTEVIRSFDELAAFPCYAWHHCVLVPCDHPLRSVGRLTLDQLAQHPLVICMTGEPRLEKIFAEQGLAPQVVLAASDADVVKRCVRQRLGIGVVAKMAYDPDADADLCALDAAHLFPANVTYLGFRRDSFQRGYSLGFAEAFAPHLGPRAIAKAVALERQADVDALFTPLPEFRLVTDTERCPSPAGIRQMAVA